MRKIREVLRLFANGKSQRSISKSLGISRKSVSEYLLRSANSKIKWPLDESLNDYELENMLFPAVYFGVTLKPQPNWEEVFNDMKKKGSTLEALHGEYLDIYEDGMSYSNFCAGFRKFKKTLNKSMKQVHKAGEKVFVDFSGPTMFYTDEVTGQKVDVQIFVGVLGASYYMYAKAVRSQKIKDWLDAHASMFEVFGGVPEMIICDNLKSAVTKASKTDPEIHPSYLEFAAHYNTMVFPAAPYSPQEKAKAEGGVLIFQRWVMFKLRKQKFNSLYELNVAITNLIEVANNRKFQKLTGTRKSKFLELDKPALKPLNQERYVYKKFLKKRVGLDYHIEIEKHFYSVPHPLVTKEVEVVLSTNIVEIIYAGKVIASHTRSYVEGKTTLAEHMLPTHRYYLNWNMDEQLDWAQSIGVFTHQFLQRLLTSAINHDTSYRISNSVKKLAQEYGDARLEAGCKRAVHIGATTSTSLRNILRNKLDTLAYLEESLTSQADFEHQNIRGPKYYN